MSCRTQKPYRKNNAICSQITEKLLEANQQKGNHNANSIHTLVDKPDNSIIETGNATWKQTPSETHWHGNQFREKSLWLSDKAPRKATYIKNSRTARVAHQHASTPKRRITAMHDLQLQCSTDRKNHAYKQEKHIRAGVQWQINALDHNWGAL